VRARFRRARYRRTIGDVLLKSRVETTITNSVWLLFRLFVPNGACSVQQRNWQRCEKVARNLIENDFSGTSIVRVVFVSTAIRVTGEKQREVTVFASFSFHFGRRYGREIP